MSKLTRGGVQMRFDAESDAVTYMGYGVYSGVIIDDESTNFTIHMGPYLKGSMGTLSLIHELCKERHFIKGK
jgi:hypothetical protein